MVGELAVHCPTVRACLSEVQSYLPLAMSMCRFQLLEEGPIARVVFEPPFSDPMAFRFTTELTLAFALRIGRHFASSDEMPLEVSVHYPMPRYAEAYRQT